MHFRNFDYIFGSLIACVADHKIFSQPEIRVRLLDVKTALGKGLYCILGNVSVLRILNWLESEAK